MFSLSQNKTTFCGLVFFFLSGEIIAQEIDLHPENTTIKFEIKHLGVLTVNGTFDEFSGSLVNGDDSWTLSGIIEASSINTKNEERDGMLQSEAYFDVEQYPYIRFEGVGIEEENILKIDGILFLKNLQPELSFYLSESNENQLSGQVTLSRKEIGFTFDSMDMLIGDEVKISIIIKESL